MLERVWQVVVAGESTPPHRVSPVWEWRRLAEGRSGREQILDPLVWTSSTEVTALLLLGSPPDIKITEMLVGHQVSGRGRDTKKVQNISVTYVCYLPGSVLAVVVGVVVVVVVGVSVVVVADWNTYEPNAVCWSFSPRDCHFF